MSWVISIIAGLFGVWLSFRFKNRRKVNEVTTPTSNNKLRDKFIKRVHNKTKPLV